jgi:2'-5' RNA ligase
MISKKFFIGFVLSKEADEYARMIAADICDKYGLRNQFEKYVPHITLKVTFTGLENNREELIEFLEKFSYDRRDISINMSSFGHFSIGVIFWDVIERSEELTTLQKELCLGLEHKRWISFDRREPNGNPHVTVAEGDTKGRFEEIFDYLKEKFPDKLPTILNKIHLFEKDSNKHTWNTAHICTLKPSQ